MKTFLGFRIPAIGPYARWAAASLTAAALIGLGQISSAQEGSEPPAAETPAEPAADQSPAEQPAAPAQPAPSEPAPEQPPAAAPPVTASPNGASQESSLARLSDPEMASQLGLSDEQRQIVARIMRDRAQALREAAGGEQQARIIESYENELAALLTDQQLARWVAMASQSQAPVAAGADGERRLRFNFRYQPWAEVLGWFAEQADLSLVLDAPPPGTFNYADTKLYTTPEAIDLLNGVLLTKGYTLIRRERMLMLLDLQRAIPKDLVPRLEFDALDDRGRFELVRVQFPIDELEAEKVAEEIKPLLGQFGSVDMLPQTKQVVVTDTAGKMGAIKAVIDSMPRPRRDDRGRPQREPEKPELVAHPLGGVSPDAALKTLEALMKDAHVVHDAKTGQLIAFATPSQQEGIRRTLEQMAGEAPPEGRYTLQVYPLSDGTATQVVAVLQPIVDTARLTADVETNNLVAWATPAQHETIQQTLEDLNRKGGTGERTLQVYRLYEAQPATLLPLITSIAPQARVGIEAATGSLVALAMPEEQAAIAKMVEQLEAAPAEADARRLATYDVAPPDSATLITALTTLVPKAQVTYNADNQELVVLGRGDEQETVTRTIEQLTGGAAAAAGENRPTVQLYSVPRDQSELITQVLAPLVPQAQVSYRPRDERLVVIGRGRDHDLVRSTLATLLNAEAGSESVFQTYDLTETQRTKVTTAMEALAGELAGIRQIPDAESGQLTVWATPAQHEVIANLVEQMTGDAASGSQRTAVAYHLEFVDAANAQQVLATLVPNAKLVLETATNQIIVHANPQDQETVRTTIEQLDSEATGGRQLKLMSYPLRGLRGGGTFEVLRQVAPGAQFIYNSTANAVVIRASQKEHDKIAEALDAMLNDVNERRLEIYATGEADPRPLQQALSRAFRDAEINADTRGRRLVVWATPDEHAAIAPAVEQLKHPFAEGEEPEPIVYPLTQVSPSNAASLLRRLYPEATFEPEGESNSILAVATPAEHVLIKSAIDQLQSASEDTGAFMVRYQLGKADPQGLLRMLYSTFGRTQAVADPVSKSVLVWAREDQHERIREFVENLNQELPPELEVSTKPYQFTATEPNTAMSVLRGLAPTATMAVDVRTGNLLVTATAEEHEDLAAAVAQIEEGAASGGASVRVFPLKTAEPYTVLSVLQQTFALRPDVRISLDPQTQKLIAFGPQQQLERVQEVISQVEATDGSELSMASYPLKGADASAALQMLTVAFPRSRFVSDIKTESIMAWARPDEHAQIEGMFAEMTTELPEERQRRPKLYRLASSDANAASVVLRPMVPQASLAVDYRTGSLMVTGTPEEHALVAEAVAQMEGDAETGEGFQARVYPVQRGEASGVLTVLQSLFALRPDVRMAVDPKTQKIVAWALPAQHETIQRVIEDIDGRSDFAGAAQVEVYSLGELDSRAALEVLNNLFSTEPAVRIVADNNSGQVVVQAPPQQQATVRATLEQMRAETRLVEVIDLQVVDPFSAQLAIENLFDTGGRRSTGPRIDSDPSTQQLFVRGTPEQVRQIRELLIKMGESLPDEGVASGTGRKLRMIPVSPRNMESLVDEIQRLWPRMRENPIRVVTPSAVAPTMRSYERDSQQPTTPQLPPQGATPPPRTPAPESNAAPQNAQPQSAPATQQATPSTTQYNGGSAFKLAAYQPAESQEGDETAADTEQPSEQPQSEQPQSGQPPQEQPASEAPAATAEEAPTAETPPVVISFGREGITIASDDTDALDQLEMLINTLTRRTSVAGREFTVYTLENANASEVADSLNQMFLGGSFGFRAGNVSIIPDKRLNALIVQASSAELQTIENLLEVLDTSEIPTSALATRPKLIPVENLRATEVQRVISEVYRTQLTSSSRRQRAALSTMGSRSSRRSPEVDAMLQQLQAANDGPEMTLGVDDATNSLVVMAAPPLFAEVEALVRQLDSAALDTNRTVRVVPLQNTNSTIVEETLQSILNSGGSSSVRSRRPGGYNRSSGSYRRSR